MRVAKIERTTKETQINLGINLDGSGTSDIETPIGFLNHMLELFAKHGAFDLIVKASGDIEVDEHHLVEDVGIVLGEAFKKAIGDKKGINRYGYFILPMDEVLTTVAFDFGGRGSLVLACEFNREKVGNLPTELVYDFFKAFSDNSQSSLIIKSEFGRNDHHKIEGIFKALAKAMCIACAIDPKFANELMTTKNLL